MTYYATHTPHLHGGSAESSTTVCPRVPKACDQKVPLKTSFGIPVKQLIITITAGTSILSSTGLIFILTGSVWYSIIVGITLLVFSVYSLRRAFPKKKNREEPPRVAEYILHLLLTGEEKEYIIGDLIEEYSEIQETLGINRAKIWLYRQAITSLWPLLRRTFYKAIVEVMVRGHKMV